MKTSLLALALMASLAVSRPAEAVGRLMDVRLYDRTTQQELPMYRYHGRYYVAGQPGHRYRIQLRNDGDERLLGVLSVDGVNAISGATADWSQTGYVLDAYTSSDIAGWRKSLSQVADFVFADAAASYAARTGRPDNVGVIGVAVFRELPPQPVDEPEPAVADGASDDGMSARASAPAAAALPAPSVGQASKASARAEPAAGPLGTGHGPRETSTASQTDFTRMDATPNEVVTIYYDTRARLIAQGVIPASNPPRRSRPDPFPNQSFVPDPD